jgi:hypothetical protein
MERVVYLLGAGFSAPLGLPVVANFIFKARDLFFAHPDKYRHFEHVLNELNALAVVKSYVSADLLDIEEVLSVLEMEEYLKGTKVGESLRRFIQDVIVECTPAVAYGPPTASNWQDMVFGQGISRFHSRFVASVLQLALYRDRTGAFHGQTTQHDVRYDVISLNYDMVLETIGDAIRNERGGVGGFSRPGLSENSDLPWLCKLHGSVDTGDIVPPTWRKGADGTLGAQWSVAHRLLSEANHLRILGYSLPVSDNYIKYLFKAALKSSRHLKTIDVITRDPGGATRARFEQFFTYKFFRFVDGDVLKYFGRLLPKSVRFGENNGYGFTALEHEHSTFMDPSAG